MSRLSPPGWLAGLALGAAVVAGLVAVPADAAQGDIQRIMYVHVPTAWNGLLALTFAFACAVLFLFNS